MNVLPVSTEGEMHTSVATAFLQPSGYLIGLLFHPADGALLFQVKKYFYLKIHISL